MKLQCPECSATNIKLYGSTRWRRYRCAECCHLFFPKRRVTKPQNFQYTEVDRQGVVEAEDCMVRATSLAVPLPYKDAHALFELAGRNTRRGTDIYTAEEAFRIAKELGITEIKRLQLMSREESDGGLIPATTLQRDDNERQVVHRTRYGYTSHQYLPKYRDITLAMLRPILKSGRFIICNHNHAWAIIDGVAYDGKYRTGRTVITQIYKIEVN